jgi:hypothetical protein
MLKDRVTMTVTFSRKHFETYCKLCEQMDDPVEGAIADLFLGNNDDEKMPLFVDSVDYADAEPE